MSEPPVHPTLRYLTKLLHYSGYTSICAYFLAFFFLKPLLANRNILLSQYYKTNLKGLKKLYDHLIAKFKIVPEVQVEYNGSIYHDEATATDKFNDRYSRYFDEPKYDPVFEKSTYVSTSEMSLKSLSKLNNRLEALDVKFKSVNIASELNSVNNDCTKLQKEARGGRFAKRKQGIDQMSESISRMKGVVLNNIEL